MIRFAIFQALPFWPQCIAASNVMPTTSEREFDDLLDNNPDRLVVLNFDSLRCGESCEAMTRAFLEHAGAQSADTVFASVDAEEAFEVTLVAGVEAVPTVKFYLNGLQLYYLEGADQAEMFPYVFSSALDMLLPCPRVNDSEEDATSAMVTSDALAVGVLQSGSGHEGVVGFVQAASPGQSITERTAAVKFLYAQTLTHAQTLAEAHTTAQSHAELLHVLDSRMHV